MPTGPIRALKTKAKTHITNNLGQHGVKSQTSALPYWPGKFSVCRPHPQLVIFFCCCFCYFFLPSFELTYMHKLGSFLLALKVSRNPPVHLCPSVKNSSVHGMSALTLGSKDEMFMGLFEQYHWDAPKYLWISSVILASRSICASL